MNAEIHGAIGLNGLMVRRQLKHLGLATVLLAVCFGSPLLSLLTFAWHSELFSYILLIPFISGYLVWSIRNTLNFEIVRPCWPGAALGLGAGAAIIVGYWLARHGGWNPDPQDYLTLMSLAILFCFWGVCLGVMGTRLLNQIFFPLAFLVFVVPLPSGWVDHIDTFFQYTSAAAAQGFLKLFHQPMWREGLDLNLSRICHSASGSIYMSEWRNGLDPRLTDFSLRVAPECSGIHSTMVLVITSFLAGYLFLRRFWTRTVFVLAMIPLAILRNGFRVSVIGWLCVHISPKMIDSPIHHKGGPIFFGLSLIPFFLLLIFLRKQDSPSGRIPNTQQEN